MNFMVTRKIILTMLTVFLLMFTTQGFSEPSAPVSVQTYSQLLSAIRDVHSESDKRIEKAVDAEKVRESWETGKLIDAHILQHKERADYGGKVIERLAADLKISSRELHYMLEFFRAYPIVRPAAQLSWSQYETLLSVNDDKARKELMDEAVRQHWNRDQVRAEVRRRHGQSENWNVEKFSSVVPGKLFTYRVVKAANGPYRGQLCLDLGFSNFFQPDRVSQFKEGDLVTLESGKLKKEAADNRFTYNAYITEVIDGDTFHAVIDLGFNIITQQKLRLRGLDAPEIESSTGREAKVFLEKHGVRPGARILVKAVRSDKYDRFLADVWADGAYINQQLFEEGLAVRVSE